MKLFRILFAMLFVAAVCKAQDDFEDFRVEVTASAWLLNPDGDILSNGFTTQFNSDLGIENESQFTGKLVLKPGRKHRILVSGTPYRLEGTNALNRQIAFGGTVYTIQETISSSADITDVYFGYQYDLVSRPQGHAGLSFGGSYFDASDRITSTTLQLTSAENITVGFPLIGGEFRAFLLPSRNLLSVNGEVKGMAFGDYGHYVGGDFNLGVSVGRHATFQAGYMFLDVNARDKDQTKGFDLDFKGPVFSVQFRD